MNLGIDRNRLGFLFFVFLKFHMNLKTRGIAVISHTPEILTLLVKHIMLSQPAPEKELLVVWQARSQSRPWGFGGSVCRDHTGHFCVRKWDRRTAGGGQLRTGQGKSWSEPSLGCHLSPCLSARPGGPWAGAQSRE